jgi:hypothetical protein
MKIGVIGCDTYYNNGQSYERGQLAASLVDLGHDVLFLPITIYQPVNPALLNELHRFKPELIILVPHVNEVQPAQLRELNCPIVLLVADDDWRRDYGLQMAQHCDYVIANAADSMTAYGAKSIPFEWAIHPPLFEGDDCQRVCDVAFVAQNYGNRRDYIESLRGIGANVIARGMGFPGGAATPEEMVSILRQSKIGLNLSKTSQGNTRQIKIRPFEIGASGAMILTEYAPGIEKSFIDGKEAVFFETIEEMTEAASYYLAHDSKRESIVRAGYERVMRDHTLARRWDVILKAVKS